MNEFQESSQIGLFEQDVSKVIGAIIRNPQQPSASELVRMCELEVGEIARINLKEAVLTLIDSKDVPSYQKDFLRQIIEDRSLDIAVKGNSDIGGRGEIKTGIDELISSSICYRDSDAFEDMIEFIGRFREYAPFNNMLVRVQNPSCSFYATERDWKNKFSRTIKEDARPMLILAPMHPVMLVYDIDSTEGEKTPKELESFSKFEGEWSEKWLERLIENANRHLIKVEFKSLSSSNSGFATIARADSGFKMRVVIHEQLDEPSRFGVLCHELAHIFLGHLGGDSDYWWPSRYNLDHSTMEIEAESVAYIVTNHLGLKGSSAAYVCSHLRGKDEVPKSVSLDNIAKVSGKLKQMANKLSAKPKTKK